MKQRSEVDYFKNINVIQMYILFNIFKYINLLEDFIADRISFIELFHNPKLIKFYSGLENVTCIDEYNDWRDAAVRKYKFAKATNILKESDLCTKAGDFLF